MYVTHIPWKSGGVIITFTKTVVISFMLILSKLSQGPGRNIKCKKSVPESFCLLLLSLRKMCGFRETGIGELR